MIEHFYQDIPGWFTFEDVYREAVCHGGRCVEVGVGNGRSAAFLAVAMSNAYHSPWLTLVDIDRVRLEAARVHADRAFRGQMGPVLDAYIADSCAAAKHVDDGTQDFVFLDADHTYEAVKADIAAWLPKVRSGGILAGHDFVDRPWSGVIRAVTEAFPRFEVWRGSRWEDGEHYPSWLYRVP